MDIAKIRKKLKKAEASAEQKTDEVVQKEKPSRHAGIDSEIEAASKTIEAKTEVEQEDAGKPEEVSKAELPSEEEVAPVKEIEILAFKIANEEYAVKIANLQEVLRYQRITAVPRAPKYLKGITSIRGKILSIIDLRDRLGLSAKHEEKKQKIIVLTGKREPLGALVGAILGVFRFPESELLPPPSTLTDEEKSFIEGVVKINNKFISILKVDELLRMEAL